jgi:hypothetical protein
MRFDKEVAVEIRQELLEKARRECKGYLAYLKGTNTQKVIDNALEIVVKQELLNIIEHEQDLTERTLEIISRFYTPLDFIYSEWLSHDSSTGRDDLTYSIKEIARTNTAYKTPIDDIDLDAYESEKAEHLENEEDDEDMEM